MMPTTRVDPEIAPMEGVSTQSDGPPKRAVEPIRSGARLLHGQLAGRSELLDLRQRVWPGLEQRERARALSPATDRTDACGTQIEALQGGLTYPVTVLRAAGYFARRVRADDFDWHATPVANAVHVFPVTVRGTPAALATGAGSNHFAYGP